MDINYPRQVAEDPTMLRTIIIPPDPWGSPCPEVIFMDILMV